jgi:hypothetical protein
MNGSFVASPLQAFPNRATSTRVATVLSLLNAARRGGPCSRSVSPRTPRCMAQMEMGKTTETLARVPRVSGGRADRGSLLVVVCRINPVQPMLHAFSRITRVAFIREAAGKVNGAVLAIRRHGSNAARSPNRAHRQPTTYRDRACLELRPLEPTRKVRPRATSCDQPPAIASPSQEELAASP